MEKEIDSSERQLKEPLKIFFKASFKKKKMMFMLITASVLMTVAQAGFYIVTAIVLDRLADNQWTLSQYWPLVGAASGLALVSVAFMVLYSYCDWRLYAQARKELEDQVFQATTERSEQFYTDNYVGTLVSDAKKFINGYKTTNNIVFDHGIQAVVSVITACLIIGSISWILAVAVLAIGLIFSLLSFKLRSREVLYSQQSSDEDSAISAQFSDTITNIDTVLTFGKRRDERKIFLDQVDLWQDKIKLLLSKRLQNHWPLWYLPEVIYLLALMFGIYAVVNLEASIGAVYLILIYFSQVISRLGAIENSLPDWMEAVSESCAMARLINTDSEIDYLDSRSAPVITSGKVELKEVAFAYSGSENLLESFNLTLSPKEQVGLVGPSGAGKTTISKLLLRMIEPQQGKVTYDDQDISQFSPDGFRQQIAYVPQETMLFHRSIFDNIAYSKPSASIEEVQLAAEKASADQFISEMPQGYHSVVGERGMKLSGGQRQRIALARAFLKDSPVIILDEPTSALDSQSEALIQEALTRLFENRTVLVVAHRLSTISHLDRIIVIKEGEIVEQGPHNQLVRDTNSHYHMLWQYQSQGFIK
jgi:ATP-binding cassette subfamily B protein